MGQADTGTEVEMTQVKYCSWHPHLIASFDAATRRGLWAYMCVECFTTHTAQRLGVGVGQILVYTKGTPGFEEELMGGVEPITDEDVLVTAETVGATPGALAVMRRYPKILDLIRRRAQHVYNEQARAQVEDE